MVGSATASPFESKVTTIVVKAIAATVHHLRLCRVTSGSVRPPSSTVFEKYLRLPEASTQVTVSQR